LSNAYRPGFSKFMGLVSAGTPAAEALNEAYGKSVEQVDQELREYLHGTQFQAVIFSQKMEAVKDEIPAEAASPFDVKLMLVDLLNRPGKEQETRAAMEKLAAEDQKRPEPFAALGYLAWRRKETDEAVKDFGTAFALGGRDPGMLWDYGRLVRQGNAAESIRVLFGTDGGAAGADGSTDGVGGDATDLQATGCGDRDVGFGEKDHAGGGSEAVSIVGPCAFGRRSERRG
jgi:hypothetical protein